LLDFHQHFAARRGWNSKKAAKTGLFRPTRYAILDIARREKRKQK